MAKNDNLTDFLTDVANAIRTKKGTTNLINPQDFSSEIESIETGGGENKLPQVADKTVIEITSEDLNGATKIGNYLFQNCTALTSAVIPNSVTSIGTYAFQNCSKLTSITIPDSVTSIGNYAFYNCRGLTSITIPNSVTSIGNSLFQSCGNLTNAIIGDGVTKITDYMFGVCMKLTNVTIPNSVTSIGSGAFQMCALTDIIIPSNVTEIKSNAFFGCSKMTTMTLLPTTPPTLASTSSIPSNVTKIEVPADSLTAYQTATNWSNFADKMVGV